MCYLYQFSGLSKNCCCLNINAVLITLLHRLQQPMSANACMNQHFTVHSTDAPRPSDGSVSVVALNETGKVRVTWRRPTLGPGQVITGYSVQYRRSGTTSYTIRSVSSSSTTSYTITNLNLGAVYEVRVASVGRLGLSGYCCGSGKQVTTYHSELTAKLMQYKVPV